MSYTIEADIISELPRSSKSVGAYKANVTRTLAAGSQRLEPYLCNDDAVGIPDEYPARWELVAKEVAKTA